MNENITYSTTSNVKQAALDIKKDFNNLDNKVILYFCSSSYNQELLSYHMKKSFPGVKTIGCSTAGEITTKKALNQSIVAMAFDEKIIKNFKIEVIENINIKSNEKIIKALDKMGAYFKEDMINADDNDYVGITLVDGLSHSSDNVIKSLSFNCSPVFIGGAAGDDLNFKDTYIHYNGKVYNNSALLFLMKPRMKFDFIKHSSFEKTDKKLLCTNSVSRGRVVNQFNHKPAAIAYADAIGCKLENLEDHFRSHPLGVIANGEPFVKSPKKHIKSNNSIEFFAAIDENKEFNILKPTNNLQKTKSKIENLKTELNRVRKPKIQIVFNCSKIAEQNKDNNNTEEYAKIFNTPTIGFNTYGEEFLTHINQTLLMLIFGE